MRSHRFRTIAVAATAATAVVGAGLAAAGPALAQDRVQDRAQERSGVRAPGFLEAGDLPPDPSSSWQAGAVTTGLPDPLPFCLDDDELTEVAGSSHHRTFTTDRDTGAVQINVTAASTEEAADLAAGLRESVAECAGDWLGAHPGGTASWEDYGELDAGDGARLYGTYTSLPNSSHDVHLFGIGRDGRTVTVVQWGQIGTLADAPVQDFRKTVLTAVGKLSPA